MGGDPDSVTGAVRRAVAQALGDPSIQLLLVVAIGQLIVHALRAAVGFESEVLDVGLGLATLLAFVRLLLPTLIEIVDMARDARERWR